MNQIPCLICAVLIPTCTRRYGGICCNSCAGFFKRSVFLRKEYECLNNSNCFNESVIQGKGCRKCRFTKCLEIGMSTYESVTKPNAADANNLLLPPPSLATLEECMRSAQIIDTLLTAMPLYIIYFLETCRQKSDQMFIESFMENVKTLQPNLISERVFALTFLLLKYSLKPQELPLFCYISACKMNFTFISEVEMVQFKLLQSVSFHRLTTTSENSNSRFDQLVNLSNDAFEVFNSLS